MWTAGTMRSTRTTGPMMNRPFTSGRRSLSHVTPRRRSLLYVPRRRRRSYMRSGRWWSPYVMMWRWWHITIVPVRRIVVPSTVVVIITPRSRYHHKDHYQQSKKPLHRLPPVLKQNWYKHYSTFIQKIQVIFKKCLTTSKTLWYNK